MPQLALPTETLPCGAFLNPDGGCEWRVWAPYCPRVELVLFDTARREQRVLMQPLDDGYHRMSLPRIAAGQRYGFQTGTAPWRPDPASRWQPDGVHAASAVWDPRFAWNSNAWRGVARDRLAIYELHVGTLTSHGTLDAAATRLKDLKELGITAIELMPVCQFPGQFGWGYDGTYWYAVQNSYGGPRALQRFVNAAHQLGIAVVLDVVFNHFGPEGCYVGEYGPYRNEEHHTPWGAAINFDGPHCEHVRAFVLHAVRYWLTEFRLDGLRLDAVHAICDSSPRHILADIRAVADEIAEERGWPVHLIAESNINDPALLLSEEQGGCGLDLQWNDDFHHSLHVLLTGEQQGYYGDFKRPAQQLLASINENYTLPRTGKIVSEVTSEAAPSAFSPERFVVSTQTHDQVGNRAYGERLTAIVSDSQLRLAAGLMLLSPQIPMLFMGEEYAEPRPFPFFCDFGDARLKDAVREGRRREFSEFAWGNDLPDPLSSSVYRAAVLSWRWPEETGQAGIRRLYQDLLTARREWPELQGSGSHAARLLNQKDGSQLLILERSRADDPECRFIVWFNLTNQVASFAPGLADGFAPVLLSESPRYGGTPGAQSGLDPYEFIVFRRTPT